MYAAIVLLLRVNKGECEMAYKSLAIANAFIQKALDAGNPPTQMKLQKLIFYAHGWHLGLTDEPLVEEAFEAWSYGPVVPNVYHEFKAFGRTPISKFGTEMVVSCDKITWVQPEQPTDKGVNALIDKIWEIYGKFSGTHLSNLTHESGTPWEVVSRPYGGKPPQHVPIPNELIRNYFVHKGNA